MPNKVKLEIPPSPLTSLSFTGKKFEELQGKINVEYQHPDRPADLKKLMDSINKQLTDSLAVPREMAEKGYRTDILQGIDDKLDIILDVLAECPYTRDTLDRKLRERQRNKFVDSLYSLDEPPPVHYSMPPDTTPPLTREQLEKTIEAVRKQNPVVNKEAMDKIKIGLTEELNNEKDRISAVGGTGDSAAGDRGGDHDDSGDR